MVYKLDYIDINKIPSQVLDLLPHAENMYLLKEQKDWDSCGLASLQATLMLQFGRVVGQEELDEIKTRITGRGVKEEGGIGARGIKMLLKEQENSGNVPPLYVIHTNTGNVSQLEMLTREGYIPTINRPWKHEDNSSKENHYELVMGFNRDYAFCFNPACEQEQHFHRIRCSRMYEFWGCEGRSWYIAAVPSAKVGKLLPELRLRGYRKK